MKLKQIPDFENTKFEDKNTVYSFSNTKLLLVLISLTEYFIGTTNKGNLTGKT
jgi:hypothetical protein